jgi:hypothetical protein
VHVSFVGIRGWLTRYHVKRGRVLIALPPTTAASGQTEGGNDGLLGI